MEKKINLGLKKLKVEMNLLYFICLLNKFVDDRSIK